VSYLDTGIVGTSRKENESRVAIHPRHLEWIDRGLRGALSFEAGYGERFGVSDAEIAELGFTLAGRGEILRRCDVVVLPKPLAEDLLEMRQGATLWGWPHCVQQRAITQAAIDRQLTLLAWEAMYRWRRDGVRGLHTFYRNNELAGYCSVLHALELLGTDGYYGPQKRAAVLGFGSVSRGAVNALRGRGFSDTAVYTQRPPNLVRDRQVGCRYRRMKRPAEPGGPATAVLEDGSTRALAEELARAEILVNGTLQDTDRPFMYLRGGEEQLLRPGSLIVDVSCDEGMGFVFARPTSFDCPIFRVGDREQVCYYGVDHSPSYLWDSATWEISEALLPHLETVMRGVEAWDADSTVRRAVEVREGVILNQKILSFQHRSPDYPHEIVANGNQ
jgi:alanine dehydrogenase